MPRLIDADALMQTLGITDMDCHKCAWADKPRTICKRGSDFEDACIAIENAPTIEERKKGKWIVFDIDEEKYDEIKCTFCKHTFIVDSHHWTDIGFTKDDLNFCPHCGADMRGEGNG